MKKVTAIAVLLLSAIILLSSCNANGKLPPSGGPIALEEDEIRTIAAAVKANNKEIGDYSIECYGKRDGIFVCRIIEEGIEPDGLKNDTIGGYTFELPENSLMSVIADGEILSLYDAYYVQKIISAPELSAIHALCHPLAIETEEQIDLLNTPPTSTGPVSLSEDELIMIAQTIMANDESASRRMAYYRIECYAKEGGVYVGFLDEPGVMYLTALESHTIGGFTFDYPSSRNMRVCDGKGVYSMKDAYDKGILSDSLLKAAYTAYTGKK